MYIQNTGTFISITVQHKKKRRLCTKYIDKVIYFKSLQTKIYLSED